MPNPALTPDERRIVEWLRGQSSTAQIKAEVAAYRFWSDDQ